MTEEELPDWVFDDDGLGVCGCGDPEGQLFWLRDLLRTMKSDDDYERRWHERKKLLGDADGPELFVLYELDARGWTEHGGSVTGSWLTERGEQWLQRLEDLCAEFAEE